MAGARSVWGIDIGRSAMKALRLRPTENDKVEILAHEYIEHAKVLTQPDADRSELIRSALEKFLSHHDISKDGVVVGVPGQHTLARFTKLPPVAPKRIPDIVRYEADQQIPFDMDEVIWDFQTFQQERQPDLEVGIFAMKRELIREHLLHFEQAAIEPIAVQSGPLAVYNALRFDGMIGSETAVLLDLGAENTDLIIATADSFWTRTVPIGGNKFTESLVKAFKLSFAKAEHLKHTAATSKYARQILQAMRPILADLVQEVQRSMGFYTSTHRDSKIEKVVCVGNAAKLFKLQTYLKQNLALPVERPATFQKAVRAGGAGGDDFDEQLLSFGVAYGLALQGLDLAKVKSNLLPTEIAKQVVWKKKRPAFAATAACLLLAGGLIWFRQSADLRALASPSDTPPPKLKDVDDAWEVMQRGPRSSLSPLDQARLINEAGDRLKRELSSLSGQGEKERRQTEALIALQRHKTIVPRILETIHESLPSPAGPLGSARTQAEVLDAIASGTAPPRDERNQVFIEQLEMHFRPDVNDLVWPSMVPVPEPLNDPDTNLPAIKIEITCRTPHKDGPKFISESFMDPLRKNGRRRGTGFYFDRVNLVDGGQIKKPGSSSISTAPGPSAFPKSSGRGRAFAPPTGSVTPSRPATVAAQPEELDPVTGEPMVHDWRFVIWVDAIPEDFPETQGEEGD